MKRIFDLFLSILLIIVLSPLYLIIAMCLLIFNKGDIFYLQERIGFNNRKFKMIKFSSMLRISEKLPGGIITLRNDPRVTKMGKFLRYTKLNELPQLFNVLIGDMSFVGPRPQVTKGFDLYPKELQQFIYKSKPGVTGISSLIFRDEEKMVSNCNTSPEDFYRKHINPCKAEFEKWYHENKSFTVDTLILILTALKIIAPSSKLEFILFPSLPKNDFLKFE
jgi:lipopolysaccharide/colanic/teichoic acid biosynthesis glycosyltransferase